MEQEIKRGDVWWVSIDDSFGHEMQTGRPALVVSADGLNTKTSTVVIAYLTTSDSTSFPSKVRVYFNGKMNAVMCNQLRTVDKSRLTRYVTTLSEEDMRRVMGALAVTFCIPYGGAPASAPPAKNDAKNTSDVVALQVELDLLRKQYNIVLEKLVEKQVSEDIAKRTESTKIPEKATEVAPPVKIPAVEPDPKKVEINTCTLEELRSIGCGQTVATSIMTHRPYKSVDDLKKVPWVTSTGFQILKNKVCCIPVIPPKYKMTPAPNKVTAKPTSKAAGKVNVNTCTWEELAEGTGLGEMTAKHVIRYRNKNGPFKKVDDLLKVDRFGKMCLKKYGSMLEV